MTPRPTATSIDDTAADWAGRQDARPLSPEEQAEFETWLHSDVRCFGAYARACAVLQVALEDTLKTPRKPPALPRMDRRWFLGGATAAVVAGVSYTVVQAPAAAARTYGSELGEIRVIPLEDGSRITLNTDSLVSVEFQDTRRLIKLLRGEAFFEVAHSATRPFIVSGPQVQVRTVGTAYSVRLDEGGPMKVLVTTGRVAVENIESRLRASVNDMLARLPLPAQGRNAVFVNAGQEALIQPVGKGAGQVEVSIRTLAPDRSERALLWRDGQLSFEGETLKQAVTEFARYSRRRIEIRDARLAKQRVSGLFNADDPEGFSSAIALSLNARYKIEGESIILYR